MTNDKVFLVRWGSGRGKKGRDAGNPHGFRKNTFKLGWQNEPREGTDPWDLSQTIFLQNQEGTGKLGPGRTHSRCKQSTSVLSP